MPASGQCGVGGFREIERVTPSFEWIGRPLVRVPGAVNAALAKSHAAQISPGRKVRRFHLSDSQMARPGNSFLATQVITEPGSVTMISISSPFISIAKKACDVMPNGAIWTV